MYKGWAAVQFCKPQEERGKALKTSAWCHLPKYFCRFCRLAGSTVACTHKVLLFSRFAPEKQQPWHKYNTSDKFAFPAYFSQTQSKQSKHIQTSMWWKLIQGDKQIFLSSFLTHCCQVHTEESPFWGKAVTLLTGHRGLQSHSRQLWEINISSIPLSPMKIKQGDEGAEEQSQQLSPTHATKQELTQNWEHPEPI